MRLALVSLLILAAPKQPDLPAPPGLWRRLPPAKRGEWLYHFPEQGETFAEYKQAAPSRPTAQRTLVYLQPWFTRPLEDPRLVERISELLAAWFGREVRVLLPGPMPARAYDAKRRQFSALKLASRLIRTLPKDALLLLAVTDRDLNMSRFDYALGWGALEHRVAVMSTHRLGKGPTARRRVLGLAVHEATHGLGLRHCVFYPCLMNGAQTPEEADRRPLQLCPVCVAKLGWNLGLKPGRRYVRLAAFLEKNGLSRDAARTREISSFAR